MLTANTDSLGGSGAISYEWKRGGTTAIGTNSSTYIVQAADLGFTITVTVTRSGNSGSVASDPTAAVTPFKIAMAQIPGGTFTMGSPASEPNRSDGETQHTVTLGGFYMGVYQVTQEEYQAVMGSNPSEFKVAVSGESGTPGKLPVERVCWYDALVFCNILSMAEGLSPAYSISGSTDPATWGTVPEQHDSTWNAAAIVSGAAGYRLPTDTQWEYACRAGTTTAYNTGATISDNTGWYAGNSGNKTHQVGLKPANAWGLYDTHGNVFEWCWEWYGDDATEPPTDLEGSIANRVIRGGSFYSTAVEVRSAYRYNNYYSDPSSRERDIGFRLVRP
jgi:formylglycine-generating enzyme required for sulfatase activity